jgi:hypothetical protein
VFDDTLAVVSDTVITYNSVMHSDTVMDFGLSVGYERAMVIQFSFPGAEADTVIGAKLRLTPNDIDGSIPARFYVLAEPYVEGDSIPSLDTLSVIVNPATGGVNRNLAPVPNREHPLPPMLVQDWLRNKVTPTAIAVVYNADSTETATFKSREARVDKPQIVVTYRRGTATFDENYRASADANFVRATSVTSNLTTSDGHVRRIYFRVPVAQLNQEAAVHNAFVRFRVVAGSVLGDNTNLIAFIPTSDDMASQGFLSGQLVTTRTVAKNADYVDFPLTNALALTLQGTLDDNGFVIRFDAENSAVRQVQFYGSSAPDSLRPWVYVTTSTKADFHPKGSPR